MAGYDQIIGRADVNDAMMPDQVINEILQTTPEDSVVLTRAKNVRMSAKKAKQPVLASLPEAYWVDGDTGLKQTTDVTWSGINITAEELAVIVPIPNAVVDDSNMVTRGGVAGLREAQAWASGLVSRRPDDDALVAELRAADDRFVARRWSPGGSADLLALTWFLDRVGAIGRD